MASILIESDSTEVSGCELELPCAVLLFLFVLFFFVCVTYNIQNYLLSMISYHFMDVLVLQVNRL